MENERLKVIGLKVDGLRKLTAIEMEFTDKGLIQFRGKNKQGKTSILDSFEILLKGTKYITRDMITHEKQRAEIIGYIGDYEIKRVITQKSNRIEIKHKDGNILGKPQEFLDTLINELTFNPRPFLNKTSEQKLRFMMDFLKIDFTAIDEKIKQVEEERLVTGRVIKKYGELSPVEKFDRVSVFELIQRKNEIERKNRSLKADYDVCKEKKLAEIRAFNEKQKEIAEEKEDKRGEIEAAEDSIKLLESQLKAARESYSVLQEEYLQMIDPEPEKLYTVDLPEPLYADTADIDIEIGSAEERNIKAERYETYSRKRKELKEEQARYQAFSDKLERFRITKKLKLRNAKVPIEGLEIREDGVYHDDIHSENWSEAEGLRISAELCLSMTPKLSAIFIDDGETYDSEGLEALRNWAEKNNLQAFITIVDSAKGTSTGDVFYIEEGEIV